MPNPALGRGLGNLMGQAGRPPAPVEPADSPANLSPGMATLLRRGGDAPPGGPAPGPALEAAEPAVPEPAPPPEPAPNAPAAARFLIPLLIGADLALAGLALRLVLKAHGPLGLGDALLCVLALGIGACLSGFAVLARK